MPLDPFVWAKPTLIRVVDGRTGKPVFTWRYDAPDGFWVKFRSGSHHLGGYQEYIIKRSDGVRAFVWGADTSVLHTYLPELVGWGIELSYPTHFQVVGYNEEFPVVSVHRELVSLFQRDAKNFSTPPWDDDELPLATFP